MNEENERKPSDYEKAPELRESVRPLDEAVMAVEDRDSESDEPDGEAREKLAGVRALKALGLQLSLAVALVASSTSSVRRYAAREREGVALVQRRGPHRAERPAPELEAAGAA